jgi:uncharacterized protein (DUF924 family)
MMAHIAIPDQVLDFWFSKRARKRWFRSTPAFDGEITERFEETWRAAARGELDDWTGTPEGAVALVIVLDQLPLNMYRGKPESFRTESAARAVAARAIERGLDARLSDAHKSFLYIPFMHSEDLRDQDRGIALYEQAGLADGLKWAGHHREIIRRFGRFPHRNRILGRPDTPEEAAWLRSEAAFRG